MTKTLCFDFGNTRLKYALFEDNRLAGEFVLEADDPAAVEAVLARHQPQKTILSSVINHNPDIETVLKANSRFHKLSIDTKLNFTAPVKDPSSIGADRLAILAAAVDLFPGKNNLAIGLGTCITYNFINKNHQFLGGGISPGLDMRFKSLPTFTAKLPLVKETWNFPLIGYDTDTNILSGVILGMAREIDGFIEMYAEKYGNFNALLTGGNTAFFAPHLKKQIFADPNLIFKGLYAISECNQ